MQIIMHLKSRSNLQISALNRIPSSWIRFPIIYMEIVSIALKLMHPKISYPYLHTRNFGIAGEPFIQILEFIKQVIKLESPITSIGLSIKPYFNLLKKFTSIILDDIAKTIISRRVPLGIWICRSIFIKT